MSEKRRRELHYSDNLPKLEEMRDNEIDLIYLDPPFNSKKTYNVIYPDDDAQYAAFSDVWSWGEQEDKHLDRIRQLHIKAIDVVQALVDGLGKVQLCAYLVNMAVRLVELHRILKPTGSLYLHCDPTASHYLKIVLDGIFGTKNFRNEIVWAYKKMPNRVRMFQKNHDIIFFYSKSDAYYYNTMYESPTAGSLKTFKSAKNRGYNVNLSKKMATVFDVEKYEQAVKEGLIPNDLKPKLFTGGKPPMRDCWTDIKILGGPTNKERLGYPTQKPFSLLERIVKASSREGDLVLDPFCGCGTTIAAAEALNRQWIGIDITYASIAAIQERFCRDDVDPSQRLAVDWGDIDIIGEPKTQEDAEDLIERAKSSLYVRKEFEKFVVAQVGGIPNERMGADGGIDGIINLSTKQKAIVSVKSGHVSVKQVRELKGILDGKKYVAGVFITKEEPTKPMLDFANQAGLYTPSTQERLYGGKTFPLLQILTLTDILDNNMPDLPYLRTRKDKQLYK